MSSESRPLLASVSSRASSSSSSSPAVTTAGPGGTGTGTGTGTAVEHSDYDSVLDYHHENGTMSVSGANVDRDKITEPAASSQKVIAFADTTYQHRRAMYFILCYNLFSR
jgi:hypothetical protein